MVTTILSVPDASVIAGSDANLLKMSTLLLLQPARMNIAAVNNAAIPNNELCFFIVFSLLGFYSPSPVFLYVYRTRGYDLGFSTKGFRVQGSGRRA
jgi:hypothetical protein